MYIKNASIIYDTKNRNANKPLTFANEIIELVYFFDKLARRTQKKTRRRKIVEGANSLFIDVAKVA